MLSLYSILCNLWQLSLDCVLQCLKEVQQKKGSNSAQLHQRSFTMLSALKDFYHSEGNGIREEDLKTDTYNVRHGKCTSIHLSILEGSIPPPFIPEASLLIFHEKQGAKSRTHCIPAIVLEVIA